MCETAWQPKTTKLRLADGGVQLLFTHVNFGGVFEEMMCHSFNISWDKYLVQLKVFNNDISQNIFFEHDANTLNIIIIKSKLHSCNIYIRLNAVYGRPVMHKAPRTGDHCFKETGAGLLKVLVCDCITNALYLMIILVSGDSLDIKELTYAIIINFTLYFDWF